MGARNGADDHASPRPGTSPGPDIPHIAAHAPRIVAEAAISDSSGAVGKKRGKGQRCAGGPR